MISLCSSVHFVQYDDDDGDAVVNKRAAPTAGAAAAAAVRLERHRSQNGRKMHKFHNKIIVNELKALQT